MLVENEIRVVVTGVHPNDSFASNQEIIGQKGKFVPQCRTSKNTYSGWMTFDNPIAPHPGSPPTKRFYFFGVKIRLDVPKNY